MSLLAWEAGQFTVQCPPLFSNLKLPFPINRSLAFPPASSQCLYSIKFLGVSKRCLYVSHVHPGGSPVLVASRIHTGPQLLQALQSLPAPS